MSDECGVLIEELVFCNLIFGIWNLFFGILDFEF